MSLTDALAAALSERYYQPGAPRPYALPYYTEEAAAILADPAFREALTAALAYGMHRRGHDKAYDAPADTLDTCPFRDDFMRDAAAIVAAMLPPKEQS